VSILARRTNEIMKLRDLFSDDATISPRAAAVDVKGLAVDSRVVKPGGRIVIIDKNQEQWGRLKTPAWEKWFGRQEMERLLARHCRSVSSRPISYWEDVAPDGLFFAWLAER